MFKNVVFYIDSLGLPNFNTSINIFLNSLNRNIFFNCKQIQKIDSAFCGFYAMLYVLHFDVKNKYRQKIVFSNNLNQNDHICLNHVRRLLKMKYSKS